MVGALLVHFDMGVAVDHGRALRETRKAVDAVVVAGPKDVAVGEEQLASARVLDERVIAHTRKVEHHLVDFRVAVAAHRDGAVGEAVEQRNDLLGSLVRGDVVTRSVVEQVA